jgi:RHS repeat-associated protein
VAVQFSPSTAIHSYSAQVVVYRNVDPTNPIDGTPAVGFAANTNSVTAPSLTTTTSGAQLLMLQGLAGNGGLQTWFPPPGMTEQTQSALPLIAGGIADQQLSSAGATGARTSTLGAAGSTTTLAGVLVALRPRQPAVLYFHQDQLGSTRLLTNDAGSQVAAYTFDAYGNATAKTGAATTPLQYAGQYTDAETGFQYLRARYYDPATGQFLSRDPIETLTREPYGYVGGNPLNGTDPTGLWCPLGKNPNGSCRGSNIANDLKVVAAVAGAAALVVSTAGIAAPGLVIAGYSASTVTTALGIGSTVASSVVAGIECSQKRDINCVADIAEALGGGVATGIGYVAGTARPLLALGSGWLGYGFDVAAFYPIGTRCVPFKSASGPS